MTTRGLRASKTPWSWRDRLIGLASAVLFVAAWEIVVRVGEIPPFILPAPSAIARSLWVGLWVAPDSRLSYLPHMMVTGGEALGGLLIGSLAGIFTGMVVAQSRAIERIIMPYVLAIQSVPKVALAPLFVIWLGYGIQSKLWIVILITFFPLLINTIGGLRSVDPDLLQLAKVAGGSKWRTFRMIKLPTALPYIFAGLEMAVVLSVVGAIVGEFVGAVRGLGVVIQQRMALIDTTGVFAVLVLLAWMGLLFSWILKLIRRRVLFWAPEERERGFRA